MKIINQLDKKTANRISAGEVITEPLGVVKELVENSIDANSSSIIVEIKNSGLESITVIDDGVGIYKNDSELLFKRHATSKIKKSKDLYNISTFGFRGEALASIAAISRLHLTSRHKEEMQGFEIIEYGGNNLLNRTAIRNHGTTIVVNDLFYNSSVRASFLKKNKNLEKNIISFMSAIAIANTNISFKLYIDDKLLFTSKKNDELSSIYEILGEDLYNHLIPIEINDEKFKINGYITDLSYSFPNRNNQYFYINNRLIENPELHKAIQNAYQGLLSYRRYPGSIIKIYTDYENVDVNIHPRKLEVRFDKTLDIYDKLNKSIRPALYKDKKVILKSGSNKSKTEEIKIIEKEELEFDFNDYSFVKESKRKYETIEKLEKDNTFNFSTYISTLNYKTSLFNTYLVFQRKDSVVYMDQHAAHEKILYEKFMNDYRNKDMKSQILILPITIDLSKKDKFIIDEKINALENLGYSIEIFGTSSIIIREIPHLFTREQARLFIFEALNNITDIEFNEESIIMASCKAAIKARDKQEALEVESILNSLKMLKDPFTCPHGRPIIYEVSIKEMEKNFERI